MLTCYNALHLIWCQLCHWICRLQRAPHFSCKASVIAYLSQVQKIDDVRVAREDAAYINSLVSLNN